MTNKVCYWLICFTPIGEDHVPRIFGFAEFIASLALLVIVYTVVDVRYRFRIAIAPLPLYQLTFLFIGIIGAESLLSEIWLAQQWWVPEFFTIPSVVWQGIFGTLFLMTFMTWIWYAFMRPPVFGRRNAARYSRELYHLIVKGSDSELPVIAAELRRSARSIVNCSRSVPPRFLGNEQQSPVRAPRKARADDYAHDLLLLIGNRKLCRHIVASAPMTALAFFDEAAKAKKFQLPLGQFAKNISGEAIANRDSNLYHETDGFSSGLLGYIKPFSQTVYGNYWLMEGLGERFGAPLDVDYRERQAWKADQWRAYCAATAITFSSFLKETGGDRHSFVLFRAIGEIEGSFGDMYKLNDLDGDYYDTDIYRRFSVAVEFVTTTVTIIEKLNQPPRGSKLRRRELDPQKDIYDLLASLMFEILFAASGFEGPPEKAWMIHHNSAWHYFFGLGAQSKTWRILQFKLRRLLYDEVKQMDSFVNFKGARVLGFCLNVMGLNITSGNFGRAYRPLARAIHEWTRRNYLRLRAANLDVAAVVLTGSITYDAPKNRLVKTYLRGLSLEAPKEYLTLDGDGVSLNLQPPRMARRAPRHRPKQKRPD